MLSRKAVNQSSFLLALTLLLTVWLTSIAARQTTETGDAAKFLARVAGVYKRRFSNGDIDGRQYSSENILEIVPIDAQAAYVRMDLEFFNGHSGKIFGIATYDHDSLVYDNRRNGDSHCLVRYVWLSDKILTKVDYEKTPGCRDYHGARGSLDQAEFPLKSRQTIRYIQRLKDSREYKEAIDAYRPGQR